jgi:hypothetical protein
MISRGRRSTQKLRVSDEHSRLPDPHVASRSGALDGAAGRIPIPLDDATPGTNVHA